MTARARRRIASGEPALVRALADGDLSALGKLYDRHAADVRRFAMRATGEIQAAEDLTHETFLAFVDAAKRFDERHAVRSFLIGIAGKLVLRRRRGIARRLRKLAELFITTRTVEEHTPEADAITDEEMLRYRRALERLSESKRVVVILADVEGLSGPEIAAALGIPIGTVWTRLHHARAELRRALSVEVRR